MLNVQHVAVGADAQPFDVVVVDDVDRGAGHAVFVFFRQGHVRVVAMLAMANVAKCFNHTMFQSVRKYFNQLQNVSISLKDVSIS
jgi:hypothetical protein